MGYPTAYLKKTLLYDESAGTLHLSSKITNLGEAANALLAAFGATDILVRELREWPGGVKENTSDRGSNNQFPIELFRMTGISDVFGLTDARTSLEFGMQGEKVISMLVEIPLPEQWQLKSYFKDIPSDMFDGDGVLENATLIISHGLTTNLNHDSLLAGYPLQNGAQIIASALQDGMGSSITDLVEKSKKAGVPENFIPPIKEKVDFLEIRVDVNSGSFILEEWWTTTAPDGLDDAFSPLIGIARKCNLKDSGDCQTTLLREITIPDQAPIILEAIIMEDGEDAFYPVRYSTRLYSQTSVGASAKALSAMFGSRADILGELDLVLPDVIKLSGFTYAPNEWILMSFAAGDYAEKDSHLISIGPLSLKEVDFRLQMPLGQSEEKGYVELEGIAVFFDIPFRVRVKPWTLIEGGLANPEGVNLNSLVQKVIPVDLPFGLETVRLSNAWVSHYLGGQKTGSDNGTDLRLRFDGSVDLIPNAITLQDIQVEVSAYADGQKEIRLAADFNMGKLTLLTSASYHQDCWIFNGQLQASEDERLHLLDLINYLGESFDASVPDKIPDIQLESFYLEYNTGTRSLDIQCITDWTIPDDIPVIGSIENKVVLQLLLSKSAQGSSSHTELSINWLMEKGGYDLTCEAYISSEIKSFSLDYCVPEVKNPIKLTDLSHALGLPEIPAPAADILDAVFQASALSMSYSYPGSQLAIAWSRPLGAGNLLLEYNQGSHSEAGTSGAGGTTRQANATWVGNKEEDQIGIKEVLGVVGQEELIEETEAFLEDIGLEAVSGVIKTVDELLTFKKLGFSWESGNKSNIFTFYMLSTFSDGMHGFLTVHTGAEKGFVLGVSFIGENDDQGLTLQDLPFISGDVLDKINSITELLGDVSLTYAMLSTIQLKGYEPPGISMDALVPTYERQGRMVSNKGFGASAMNLNKGVSVGVKVSFSKKSLVRKVIDIESLYGQLSVGPDFVAAQIAIPLGLKLDAGGGTSLSLTSPIIQVKVMEAGPELDIMGGLELRLFSQKLSLNAWLALSVESVTGHVQITEIPGYIPIPAGSLRGVFIVIDKEHPLSLEVGVQFEPPGLDLGVSGYFSIYKNEKDLIYGKTVLVLEVEEEVVTPLYIEFSMDEMSVPILLEAVTGVQRGLHLAGSLLHKADELAEDAQQVAGNAATAVANASKTASAGIEAVESAIGHVEALMSKVAMKDVQLYLADSVVNLPDGTTVMPGIGFRGELIIFDWKAFAMMDISMSGIPGISGHFECETIAIGSILRIWGDGLGISKTPQSAEELYKKAKNKVDKLKKGEKPPTQNLALQKDEGDWYLKPGGPVLHFSTRSSPFLHADLHAELFGVLHTDIHAEITDEGFLFDFKIGADQVASAELECHWWKSEGQFEAHGNMNINLLGEIGPVIPHIAATKISLNTSLNAAVNVLINKDKFEFRINGDFVHQGARFTIPEFTISVQFKTLADLAKSVWDWIVEKAEHIFAEYFASVTELFNKGAEEVKKVAAAAYEFGKNTIHEAAQEVDRIEQMATAGLKQAADKVAETAVSLKNQADQLIYETANEVAKVTDGIWTQVRNLDNLTLALANDVEQHLKHIADTVTTAIADAARYVLDVASKASEWIDQQIETARKWVTDQLKAAEDVVRQFLSEADDTIRAIAQDIEQIISEVKEWEEKLNQLLDELAEEARREAAYAARLALSAEHTVTGLISSGWHKVF